MARGKSRIPGVDFAEVQSARDGGDYARCVIRLRRRSEYDRERGERVLDLEFQANRLGGPDSMYERAPAPQFDYGPVPYGPFYAGHIDAGHDFAIERPGALVRAAKILDKINAAIDTYNLALKHPDCEASRVMEALERLNVPIHHVRLFLRGTEVEKYSLPDGQRHPAIDYFRRKEAK